MQIKVNIAKLKSGQVLSEIVAQQRQINEPKIIDDKAKAYLAIK